MAIEAMEVEWGLRERISLILVGVLEPLEVIVKSCKHCNLATHPLLCISPQVPHVMTILQLTVEELRSLVSTLQGTAALEMASG